MFLKLIDTSMWSRERVTCCNLIIHHSISFHSTTVEEHQQHKAYQIYKWPPQFPPHRKTLGETLKTQKENSIWKRLTRKPWKSKAARGRKTQQSSAHLNGVQFVASSFPLSSSNLVTQCFKWLTSLCLQWTAKFLDSRTQAVFQSLRFTLRCFSHRKSWMPEAMTGLQSDIKY